MWVDWKAGPCMGGCMGAWVDDVGGRRIGDDVGGGVKMQCYTGLTNLFSFKSNCMFVPV